MSLNYSPNPEGQGLKKCPTSRKYVSMNFLYLSVGSGEISETSNLKNNNQKWEMCVVLKVSQSNE